MSQTSFLLITASICQFFGVGIGQGCNDFVIYSRHCGTEAVPQRQVRAVLIEPTTTKAESDSLETQLGIGTGEPNSFLGFVSYESEGMFVE